jgi:hypothetical protein
MTKNMRISWKKMMGQIKFNDPMEEDDGTNQMIQDLFSQLDEDGDNVGIYDEPLLEKANKRLYEG